MTNKAETVSNQQLRNLYVANVMIERQLWLKKLLDPRRDIDAECGHPTVITLSNYLESYKRGDIAARVVNVWPEESWAEHPYVYETEDPSDTAFELRWKETEEEFAVYSILQRTDILSGIGRFGIVLIGLDDGRPLADPVPLLSLQPSAESKERQLTYLRPFDESCVSVSKLETDITNPRYGLPLMYQLQFQEVTSGATSQTGVGRTVDVHWSRVIHVADNRLSSEIYGQPRMERSYNRLLDLKKIVGGSAEMFWKGGFPGLSLETLPEVVGNNSVELDIDSTKTQLESYMNGLQRYIATVGMKANSLSVQVADPMPHLDAQLKLIAVSLGIPWRIFVGSEAAQLASDQDSKNWNRRIARRRNDYLTPYLVRPLIARLVDMGVLPTPKKLFVTWPDLNTPSDKDKSLVAENRTKSLVQYFSTGVSELVPPFLYYSKILGMTDEEARAIVEEAEAMAGELPKLEASDEDPEEDPADEGTDDARR